MKKLIVLGVAVAMLAVVGGRTALAGPDKPKADNQPSTVALAMGTLREADGGSAVIDLRAGIRDGQAAGNFRFYSSEQGYYNGAVRQLSIENGVILAKGAGALARPDGTRTLVRYTATLSVDSKHMTVAVEGRNGSSYTLEGSLDPGFVRAGSPPEKQAAAQPKDRPAPGKGGKVNPQARTATAGA